MQYAGSGGGTGIYGIGPDGAGGTFSNGSYSPPFPSPHGGGGGSNGQTADMDRMVVYMVEVVLKDQRMIWGRYLDEVDPQVVTVL